MYFIHLLAGLVIATLSISVVAPLQAAAPTAALRLTPSASTVTKDSTISVTLNLDTGGQAVVGAKIAISHTNNLSYVDANYDGSIFSAETDNGTGNPIIIGRLRFDTGYAGTNGKIVVLTFKGLSAGTAVVSIEQNNSQVVAFSDGTNILNAVSNTQFSVVEPAAAIAAPAAATNQSSTSSGQTEDNLTNENSDNPTQITMQESETETVTANPTTTAIAGGTTANPVALKKSGSSSKKVTTSPKANQPSLAPATTTSPSPTPIASSTSDLSITALETSYSSTPTPIAATLVAPAQETNWTPIVLGLLVAIAGIIALPFVLRQAFRSLHHQEQ